MKTKTLQEFTSELLNNYMEGYKYLVISTYYKALDKLDTYAIYLSCLSFREINCWYNHLYIYPKDSKIVNYTFVK